MNLCEFLGNMHPNNHVIVKLNEKVIINSKVCDISGEDSNEYFIEPGSIVFDEDGIMQIQAKHRAYNNKLENKVGIYSREEIEKLIEKGFPENTVVISFYTPGEQPVDYKGKAARLLQIGIHDIDLEVLPEFGLTYDTYFPEAKKAAKFIHDAYRDKLHIICQCDYGQSRSAACAAAILEFFEGDGISIYKDYRYYPNQLIFNKLYGALKDYKKFICK